MPLHGVHWDKFLSKLKKNPRYEPSEEEKRLLEEETAAERQKFAEEREEFQRYLEKRRKEKEIRWREGPFPFADFDENGRPVIVDCVPLNYTPRSRIRPEQVLELYQKNLTANEIAQRLGRDVEKINKILAQFGIKPAGNSKRKYALGDIPFGWKQDKERLYPEDGEQWVLEKMAKDRKQGRSFEEIADELERLGIKPRGGGKWFARRVSDALSINQALTVAREKGDSVWDKLEKR